MRKILLFGTLAVTSFSAFSQSGIENISSGTWGDAVLTIQADTDNDNEHDNPRIELLQDGDGHGAFIGFNHSWGGAYYAPDNLFRIGTRSSGTDFYNNITIKPGAGFVGIGSSNPLTSLHISSNTSGDAILRIEADIDNNDDTDNARIELLQDGNGMVLI